MWCRSLSLSDLVRRMIQQVRKYPPIRSIKIGRKTTTNSQLCTKMAREIPFESYKLKAVILELEFNQNIYEYYKEPPAIRLQYRNNNGRILAIIHTPDFFVIRKTEAGWENCKTEEELIRLKNKSPFQYTQGKDGTWRCLLGEKHANQYGLYYRIKLL